MSTQQTIVHAVIVGILIVAYTALTIAGHDGNALIGALGGYLGGATVVGVATKEQPSG